jgi:hypothetical protein
VQAANYFVGMRVRVRRPGRKRFRATVPQRLTIGPEIGSEVNAPLN